MEEQNNPQPIMSIQNSKNIWIILFSVIITALVVSGGVYAWQRYNTKLTEQSLRQQITYLQNQINQLQRLQNNQNQKIDQSATVQNNLNDFYNLDYANNPDDFQSKYSWYKHFKEQIIDGWELNTICYNKELNKVAYLKSKIDYANYKYDQNRKSYGSSQLGIYDIAKDEYDKAPAKNLGFYEGCATIKQWLKNDSIIYQCGAGDAGVGSTQTYSFDIIAKSVKLIQTCDFEAGRNPEEICK